VWETLAVQGGPWALIGMVVLSIVRGWLIPRRTHLDRVADLKAAISALEETVHEQKTQMGILLGRVREPSS